MIWRGTGKKPPEERRNNIKSLDKVVDSMLQIKSGIYNGSKTDKTT